MTQCLVSQLWLYLGQVADRWPDPEVLADLVLVEQVNFRHCSAFRANHVRVYMHVNTQFLFLSVKSFKYMHYAGYT